VVEAADRIKASPIGARLAQGAIWSLIGATVSRGLVLIASIAGARILGKQTFGELGMIQSTLVMLQGFGAFGLGLTATKFVAESYRDKPLRAARIISLCWWTSVATGSLMTVSLFVLAPWIASRYLAAPQLARLLRISSPTLFLGAVAGMQMGALVGFESFRAIARINVLGGLATFPLVLAGAYWFGLEGAVCGLACSSGLSFLLSGQALRFEAKKSGLALTSNGWQQERGVLWTFAFPAFLNVAMVAPVNWACAAMLVNQPGGYAEMGVFNAANQWWIAIMFLPGTVGAVVLPVLASLRGAEDNSRYKKVLSVNVLLNAGLAVAVGLPVCLLSSMIMSKYGRGFESGAAVLVVLVVAAILSGVIGVIGQTIASDGRMWWGMFLNLIWGGAMIVGMRTLPVQGALGLALATLIAYCVHLVTVGLYTYFFVYKRLSIVPLPT
jgi:O-antigen/teichoic acid export membrane protein